MQAIQMGKTLPSRDILHEIKNLSQNLTLSQLSFGRVAKAVKQVQGDDYISAYTQGENKQNMVFCALKHWNHC